MIQNERLCGRIRELALNVLKAYQEFMNHGGWQHVIYRGNIQMLLEEAFMPSGKARIVENTREPNLKLFLPSIDIFESLLDGILKDESLNVVNDFSSKLTINPNFGELFRTILIDFLCRYIKEIQEKPDWVVGILDSDFLFLYERLESFLYAEKQFFRFVLPIAHFTVDGMPLEVKIGENLRIVEAFQMRRDMEATHDIFKRDLYFQPVFPELNAVEATFETEKFGNLGTPDNKLILTKDQVCAFNIGWNSSSGGGIVLGNIGHIPEEVGDLAYKFMTALRLVKSGNVGYSAIYIDKPDSMFRWMVINPPLPLLPRREPIERYVLTANEVEKVKELFRSLCRIDTNTALHSKMSRAIDRFNTSYQKMSAEDRLVDYVIVLETLLLEEQDELSYRLALRTSMLLGKNEEEEVERTFQFIKLTYDLRSCVVHGGNKSKILRKIGADMEVVVLKLEDYTRRAVSDLLVNYQQCRTKKEILKLLDKMILKPNLRLSSLALSDP